MTGYAITQQAYDLITVSIELKSVNHRYLALSFKLPEEWHFLEYKMAATFLFIWNRPICSRRKFDQQAKTEISKNERQKEEVSGASCGGCFLKLFL